MKEGGKEGERGKEGHPNEIDRDSGPKAMELGRGSFAEMEWPFIYYLSYIYFSILYLYIVLPAKTK